MKKIDFKKLNLKEKLKKVIEFILNPKLLLCVGIAWMITNGWSYVFFAVGTALQIGWMAAVGGAYLAFLWLPISPEKIVTFAIAIGLLKLLFPNDQKTLAVLRHGYETAKSALKRKKKDKDIAKAEVKDTDANEEVKTSA